MRDCATYLDEISTAHDCNSTLLLVLGGSVGSSHWILHVLSNSDELVGFEPKWSVASMLRWPNRENKTFESALFRALAEHDALIEKRSFTEALGIT